MQVAWLAAGNAEPGPDTYPEVLDLGDDAEPAGPDSHSRVQQEPYASSMEGSDASDAEQPAGPQDDLSQDDFLADEDADEAEVCTSTRTQLWADQQPDPCFHLGKRGSALP